MKKFFIVLALTASLFLVSCGTYTDSAQVNNTHIPSHVSHIEFWNGGTMIREFDNANVSLRISNSKHIPASVIKDATLVTFYTYIVKCDGIETQIIDSESLSIVYQE